MVRFLSLNLQALHTVGRCDITVPQHGSDLRRSAQLVHADSCRHCSSVNQLPVSNDAMHVLRTPDRILTIAIGVVRRSISLTRTVDRVS